MLKLKIAVTGGINSGKSAVCRYFKQFGAYIVDTDAIVHELLSQDTYIKNQVIKLFGNLILTNEEIERKKLAKIVFEDYNKLLKLEKILHPIVLKKIEEKYKQFLKDKKNILFVVEIPLLFEVAQEKFYDYIIMVLRDKAIINKEREKRFLPIEEKIKKSDFVIKNNSSFTMLKRQVQKIITILLKNKEKKYS